MGVLGPVLPALRLLVFAATLASASAPAASPPTSPADAPAEPTAEAPATPPVASRSEASHRELEGLLDELARDPIWLALVHQARHRISGATRDAFLEAGFFLDPEGARRPRLELIATRAAFLDPNPEAAQRARCRFPARYQLLVERGLVPDAPRGDCPELDAWRAQIGAFEMTLVFPDAFLGNPASMFGHTLLRFDPLGRDGKARDESLLGWTLDYTADAEGDQGVGYLLRGLIGGYRGQFGISPYYEKTKLYSDWQDRDIWEYPLSMPERDRERVLLHVWEVQDLLLPYYFFTQNCSEKLLELLEVGWPELGRGGGFPPTVAPVDTLRAMAGASPDALGAPRLRPSPASKLQAAFRLLERPAADLAEDLAWGRRAPDDPALAGYSDALRARILTLAYDLLRHAFLAGRISDEDSRARSRALLRARSRVRVPNPPEAALVPRDHTPPDRGHGTAQVALAGGLQDRDAFVELRLLPAYHTLIDAPGGFAEGGEIKVLETAVRYYPELDRVRLQELLLLDVSSASPWRRPFRPLAWHAELGLRTRLVSKRPGRGLDTEPIFRAQAGPGIAFAPTRGLHLYSFAELVVEAAPAIEGDAAAGPLARAGLSWSSEQGGYTIRLEGLAGALLGRDPSEWLGAKLEQRVGLGRQWSIVLGGHFDRAYGVGHFEGRLGLTRYF